MTKLNERMEAGTDAAIPTNVQVNHVSQTIAKPPVMRRYVIMGVEFDNLWKPIELFVGENEFDILLTTDDFKDAAKYVDLESAEYVIEYLNNNYSDYSWHVVVSINGA